MCLWYNYVTFSASVSTYNIYIRLLDLCLPVIAMPSFQLQEILCILHLEDRNDHLASYLTSSITSSISTYLLCPELLKFPQMQVLSWICHAFYDKIKIPASLWSSVMNPSPHWVILPKQVMYFIRRKYFSSSK